MNRIILSAILVSTILFSGCKNSEKESDDPAATEANRTINPVEADAEAYIDQVDHNKKLEAVKSLAYNNNEGSTEEAVAYLENKAEVKIEETYSDATKGTAGSKVFYIKNGKKLASKEVFSELKDNNPVYFERVTYYDKNNKPVFSKIRTAVFENDLEQATFEMTKPVDCPIEHTLRIINQEGEFATTFQGIVEGNGMTFLLVGGKGENDYVSSLAIQYLEGDIKKLMTNQQAMLGTPLQVDYQSMIDERGMSFQVLLFVKILN